MKKTYYLYSDFETTKVELPKEYDTYKDYFDNCPNPKQPEVYSWNVLHSPIYKNISSKKPKVKKYELGKFKDEVHHYYGVSGKSFIKFCESIQSDVVMYFNNLKGFDGHFIIPLLDAMGYECVLPFDLMEQDELDEEIKVDYYKRVLKIKTKLLAQKNIKEKYESIIEEESIEHASKYLLGQIRRKWKLVSPKQYSVVTNGNNQIFEIKIGLKDLKTTKGVKRNRALIIRDNMHIFPSSIKKMGETIAKNHLKEFYPEFTNEEKCNVQNFFAKKDLDGGYNRTELYKNVTELKKDGNELEYLIQDTYILYRFHKDIEKHFPRKDWKLTIGGTSYNEWINKFGKKLVKNMLDDQKLLEVKLKRGAIRYQFLDSDKLYSTKAMYDILINKLIPTRWLENEYDEYMSNFDYLYKWYGGGITFVNDIHRGKLMKNLKYVDLNSSYPSQMHKHVLVPFGRGHKGNKKGYDFKFYKLIPKRKIYNKTGLPFLWNEIAEKREYASVLEPNSIYRFTSISLDNFLEYYDADADDFELSIEYSFQSIPIDTFFGDFIDEWYAIKEQASIDKNEILKFIAKLFINNTYGKFGTKMERISKYWNQHETEWVEFRKQLQSKYYLPLAIAITELGRKNLVDGTGHMFHKVVYGDTDSLVITDFKHEEFPNIEFHKTHLGKWDVEFDNAYGVFRRAKQYMMINDKGEHKVAYSGINFNKFMLSDKEQRQADEEMLEYKKLSLADFISGKKIDKQTSPYRLLGSGIILHDSIKSIKPVWDYDPLPHQTRFQEDDFVDDLAIIQNFGKQNQITIQ